MMETNLWAFFDRYVSLFNRALDGDTDMDGIAAMYASEFIAASPTGVMGGKNDEQLRSLMSRGYERYRALGTKKMRLRNLRLTAMDAPHCVAHVGWTATYARAGRADVTIDFDVHYFVQKLNGEPQIFGWVAGDEQALLRSHGII